MQMKCIVCDSIMEYSFSKQFHAYGLGYVDYWRCTYCGFVQSKTHADMSDDQWSELNENYHAGYHGTDCNADDPRWLERLEAQVSVLDDLGKTGFLDPSGKWLDYACGDGRLSDMLHEKRGRRMLKYEKYMPMRPDYLRDADLQRRSFDFVISTSVMEHLRARRDLENIESLVSDSGVLGIHTLVCENVPRDESWFYLIPVHCSFYTNKSMSILFSQWGYTSSIYNVNSRLWLLFRGESDRIEELVANANRRPAGEQYIFKRDFVDYWKGFP